jgi:hypothetical protein
MPKSIDQMNRDLSRRIMRRVYFVWGLRMVLNPLFLKSLIALVLLSRSTAYISYSNVLANRPVISDIPRNLAFVQDAFMQTEVTSVFLVLGTLAVMAWLATDVLRKQSHSYF